ncbi:hypothetical protein [Jeotgalibaca porci]|uniref:hypothetical protein n=1 Tax=Jeotgalibaca porci TaxID=1868793 RepID=UPI0035A084D5
MKLETGDIVFVKTGKMAGTYATVSYVRDKFVYLQHRITGIEFRCNIKDVGW